MLSLHEIDFPNRDFGVGFMATSFPTALEEEMDMSLTDLMIENGMCNRSWWDNFTKYYDGVLEESDGYVDEPETLICELADHRFYQYGDEEIIEKILIYIRQYHLEFFSYK